MTDEQFKSIIEHLERIERHLSAMSGLVFLEEVETVTKVIEGVVAPSRKLRRPPNG